MPPDDPNEPVRTPDDIAEQICALAPAQWGRLRQIADSRAFGRPIEGKDLLQEALCRALEGERRCPVSVDLVRFIAEAMRSIADGELKKAMRRPALLSTSGDPGADTPAPEIEDPAPTAQQHLEAQEEYAAILQLFDGDFDAQIMIEGIIDGKEGEELRALTDLDRTAFDSKRRLIRRRLLKRYRGQKP